MELYGLLKLARKGGEERIEITIIDKTGLHLGYGTLIFNKDKWKLLKHIEQVNKVKGIEDLEEIPNSMQYLSMCEVDSISTKDGLIKASIMVF